MKQVTDNFEQPISRRTALKAIGATLTLPFLPSLSWAERWVPDPTKPPRRWAAMVFPNGVNVDHWWAKGAGGGMELSKSLSPLARFKNDITVINGLRAVDSGKGFHADNFTNWLNGFQFTQSRTQQKSILPQSIDRHLASTIGGDTILPAIHLGVEPPKNALWSTFSWSHGQTPILPEIQPRMVFDSLFDSAKLEREKSLLDMMKDQAKDVNRKLGYQDRHKMDQFLTSVREIEQRIDKAINDERPAEYWRPDLKEPPMSAPAPGLPKDTAEHQRLMIDLMVLALQMDKTRVATFIFHNDSSNINYGFVPGVENRGMHGAISHHQHDPETLRQYQLTNEHHVSLLAYAMEKMSQVDEGDGTTLLDNTMLTFGSNMMDGNSHYSAAFPVVLVGGANCDIKGGRVLDFTDQPVEHRRLMNLHLATAQRMGANLDAFGNSTFPVENLGSAS